MAGNNFPNEDFLSSVLRCSVLFKFMFFLVLPLTVNS